MSSPACRLRALVRSFVLATAAALALSPAIAHAQSAFTYQGRLKFSGAPYSGTADVRFTLYDAANAGSVIGAPVDVLGATITDGVFSETLDFGALAFDGSPRWLEIDVATPGAGGVGPYSTLSPRQAVTPVPYAMHAAVAGLVPDAALNGAYTSALSMTNAGNSFAGDGSGLTNLDASNIATGVLGSGQLGGTYSSALTLNNAGNVFAGDGSGLTSLGWSSLIGVPPGFADGIDDIGSGSSQWTGTPPNNIYYLPGAAAGVGIGTSTPDGRLQITGGPGWTLNGWTKSLTLDNGSALELGKGGATKYGLGASGNNFYLFQTATDTSVGDSAHYVMTVLANGRVGINTTTPSWPLTVGGNPGDWAIRGATSAGGYGVVGSSTGANSIGVRGFLDSLGYAGVSGEHGLGTFGLLGTANEGVYGGGGVNNKVGVVGVAGGNNGIVGAHTGTSTIYAGIFGYSNASSGNGIIGEANTGTAAYGVWGRAAQGIGGYFTGGQYAIVAAGKAKVNTIEIVGGSDLAEPFDVAHLDDQGSQQDIAPGMVVVIDSANEGALKVSTHANDRKVAGIISGANDLAPGMVMKSEGVAHADGAHPVALTGRVWCWCDATHAAIEAGDMLTTSDTPGHAMKVTEFEASQGAILGKSMTSLAQGQRGLVLVLVNLQ